eukprot:TRINITY_DN33273_c0_g1_i1.p1 TRINITY_DN33273_c0_g1~~TRINITY_DN33273_c0_g1_i1.p1  ORF type:complete len:121 (+),score=26.05 TRINITY_DN33273_c0_g1_i1:128-490(+)
MIRRPPRSTLSSSSAASDVYKRQIMAECPKELRWQCVSSPEAKTASMLLAAGTIGFKLYSHEESVGSPYLAGGCFPLSLLRLTTYDPPGGQCLLSKLRQLVDESSDEVFELEKEKAQCSH